MNHRVRTILIGESEAKSSQLLICSLLVLFGLYALLTYTGSIGETFNNWLGRSYNLIILMTLLLVVAAIASYLNNGLIVCILLVVAPLMGFFLSGNIGFVRDPTLTEYALYALQGGFLYGVPLGVTGYLIGRALSHAYPNTFKDI
jgi:hypothetical protein